MNDYLPRLKRRTLECGTFVKICKHWRQFAWWSKPLNKIKIVYTKISHSSLEKIIFAFYFVLFLLKNDPCWHFLYKPVQKDNKMNIFGTFFIGFKIKANSDKIWDFLLVVFSSVPWSKVGDKHCFLVSI